MSSPFASSQAGPDAELSPGIRVARVVLLVSCVGYVLLGVGLGALFWALPGMEPGMEPVDVAMLRALAVVMPFSCFFVAGANLVPLLGFGSRATWAWALTFALATLYLGSACFPLGLVLLWALLNTRTRREFLGA